MLVIKRRVGELVVIGDGVYCTVLDVSGSSVRLGFDAPRALPIHRLEIQNLQAFKEHVRDDESIVDGLINQFKRRC